MWDGPMELVTMERPADRPSDGLWLDGRMGG